MSKVAITIITVVLLIVGAFGIMAWATDGNAPTAKELIRRQILKVIDENEVNVNAAKKKVEEFGSMVQSLKRTAARTMRHTQELVAKETHAQHGVSVVESELRFIQEKLKQGEPIRAADGSILTPEEIELRTIARGEELAGARECLQVIASERRKYENMSKHHAKNLRLAPCHFQVLKVRLAALETKVKMYRDHKGRLDDIGADADAYSAIYNEAKRALGVASDSLGDAFGTVDTGFKPLLRDASAANISTSGASTDRALARIDALLTSK